MQRPHPPYRAPSWAPRALGYLWLFRYPSRAIPQCCTLIHPEPEEPAGSVHQEMGGRRDHAKAAETVRKSEASAISVSGDSECEVGGWGVKGTEGSVLALICRCLGDGGV
jgi:hypothetical protein